MEIILGLLDVFHCVENFNRVDLVEVDLLLTGGILFFRNAVSCTILAVTQPTHRTSNPWGKISTKITEVSLSTYYTNTAT